jgi:NADPH-dependent 7-cyano-7-deazaguanine reductase QueF
LQFAAVAGTTDACVVRAKELKNVELKSNCPVSSQDEFPLEIEQESGVAPVIV